MTKKFILKKTSHLEEVAILKSTPALAAGSHDKIASWVSDMTKGQATIVIGILPMDMAVSCKNGEWSGHSVIINNVWTLTIMHKTSSTEIVEENV